MKLNDLFIRGGVKCVVKRPSMFTGYDLADEYWVQPATSDPETHSEARVAKWEAKQARRMARNIRNEERQGR